MILHILILVGAVVATYLFTKNNVKKDAIIDAFVKKQLGTVEKAVTGEATKVGIAIETEVKKL